jgi:hypothetical protein
MRPVRWLIPATRPGHLVFADGLMTMPTGTEDP